ncbi:CotH kinase family protein [Akkermansiaceae bacterium]|nr:CotH kinase family protein [Akkermansiaceae bacterium]
MFILRQFFFGLFAATASLAQPVITEFLAANDTGLQDEDGGFSDWIEIYNPGPGSQSLSGWQLTDDPAQPAKWSFPDVSIPANDYLVVFASGKDRATAGSTLHTNFKLSVNGEYLALTSPSSVVVSEYTFPEQATDISYGSTTTSNEVTLVTESSPAKAHVPDLTYDSLVGTTWRSNDPLFDDSTWQSGALGVGLERTSGFENEIGIDIEATAYGNNSTVYIRVPIPGTIDPANVETLTLRMKYDDGFAAFINGTYAAGANDPSSLAWNSDSMSGVSDSNALQFENFDISHVISDLATTNNLLVIHGMNQFSVSGDMLIRPELVATLTNPAPPSIGYFSSPTPGTTNPGTNNSTPIGAPSGEVTTSDQSGIKSEPISVTLTAENASAEIRYTLDGSDPTELSSLYLTPLQFSDPVRLRARAFEPDRIGGPIAVADYAFLDSSMLSYLSDIPVIVMDNFGAGNYPNKGRSNDGRDVQQVPRQANIMGFFEPRETGLPFTLPATLESRAGCRVRGSSSSTFPRKPLSVEFWKGDNSERKLSPFSFDAEADWVLNPPNPSFDRALIHNPVSFEIAKALGALAPESKVVAVFQNTNGGKITPSDLEGIYIFSEKVERNRMGVDFETLDETGQSGGWMLNIDRMPAIPVGLPANTIQPNFHAAGPNGILEIPDDQQNSGGSQSADDVSEYYHSYLNFHTPNGYGITNTQRNEIQTRIRALDTAVWASNFDDPVNGYRAHLDSDSWARSFAIHNFAKNQDAHVLSTYLYRETPTSKIKMGPVWDFDRAYTWKGSPNNTPRWAADRDWFPGLFDDPNFEQTLQDIWQTARQTTATDSMLESIVDQAAEGPRSDQVSASGLGYATWQGRISDLRTWVVNRAHYLDSQYEALPAVSPAEDLFVGTVDVTLTPASGGTIYYTTDGSDPRLDGGGISPAATAYSAPLTLSERTRLILRTRDGSDWSGPVERNLYRLADLPQLVISEIQYHPADPSPAEEALGFDTSGDFEYLEIENIGSTPADLSSLALDEGITFTFPSGSLAVGERILIVKNLLAFEARYGAGLPIVGEFAGSLDNAGDTIVLKDVLLNFTFQDFDYGDTTPWPVFADGDGYSLTLKNPSSNPDHSVASNWRCSSLPVGNPGTSDARPVFSGDPKLDQDHDGLGQMIEHYLGTLDSSLSQGNDRIQFGSLVGADNQTYPTLEVTYLIGADDLSSTGEWSSDLKNWSSLSTEIHLDTHTLNGDGTATTVWRSDLPFPNAPQFLRLKVTQE